MLQAAAVLVCEDLCASRFGYFFQVIRVQDCAHYELWKYVCVRIELHQPDSYDPAFDLHICQQFLPLG